MDQQAVALILGLTTAIVVPVGGAIWAYFRSQQTKIESLHAKSTEAIQKERDRDRENYRDALSEMRSQQQQTLIDLRSHYQLEIARLEKSVDEWKAEAKEADTISTRNTEALDKVAMTQSKMVESQRILAEMLRAEIKQTSDRVKRRS